MIWLIRATALCGIFVFAGCDRPAGPEAGPPKTACDADIKKFCDEVQPGEGRVLKCLADVKDQLSGDCRQLYFAPPDKK
jgi:hypothetical protein